VTAAALKPWAVDSLTHTNKNLDDGTFCKDLERAESFVKAANGV
jgi:phosphoribosylanthranilate isomerase